MEATKNDYHLMIAMVVGSMLMRHLMDSPQLHAAIVGREYEEEQRYFDREFKLIVGNYE